MYYGQRIPMHACAQTVADMVSSSSYKDEADEQLARVEKYLEECRKKQLEQLKAMGSRTNDHSDFEQETGYYEDGKMTFTPEFLARAIYDVLRSLSGVDPTKELPGKPKGENKPTRKRRNKGGNIYGAAGRKMPANWMEWAEKLGNGECTRKQMAQHVHIPVNSIGYYMRKWSPQFVKGGDT